MHEGKTPRQARDDFENAYNAYLDVRDTPDAPIYDEAASHLAEAIHAVCQSHVFAFDGVIATDGRIICVGPLEAANDGNVVLQARTFGVDAERLADGVGHGFPTYQYLGQWSNLANWLGFAYEDGSGETGEQMLRRLWFGEDAS